jgi:DNA-binding transcriptional regulator YdaS (Cro superfamily)
MNASIKKAVETSGSQSELARRINVRQGTLWKWLIADRAPAEYCIAIERATGGKVTRYDLRPDVFGPAPDHQEAA